MNIFFSWSGKRSYNLATSTSELLNNVFPELHTWISSIDIKKGVEWLDTLLENLKACKAAFFFITLDNLHSSWIAFEYGILKRIIKNKMPLYFILHEIDNQEIDKSPFILSDNYDTSQNDYYEICLQLNKAFKLNLTGLQIKERFNESWIIFENGLRTIPNISLPPFMLYIWASKGFYPLNVDLPEDLRWKDFVNKFINPNADIFGINHAEVNDFKIVDLVNQVFLPVPTWVSQLKSPRIALVHPETCRENNNSAKFLSINLNTVTEYNPKLMSQMQSIGRDLRDLYQKQKDYYEQNKRYSTDFTEINFYPSPGANIWADVVGEQGCIYIATRDTAGSFGIRIGDGAGYYTDKAEGEIFTIIQTK